MIVIYPKVELDDSDMGKYAAAVKAAKSALRPAPVQAIGELSSTFNLFGKGGAGAGDAKAKTKGSKF